MDARRGLAGPAGAGRADDDIAPPSAVRAVAAKAGAGAEVLELPSGHFDIYSGEMYERSAAAQVAFLQRTLRVSAPTG